MSEPLAITALLDCASEHLEAASRGERSVFNAVLALRSILLALGYPGAPLVPAIAIERITEALDAAAPAVAGAARCSLPEEEVFLGMWAASGLVLLFGRPAVDLSQPYPDALVRDRIDHTALLADELDALHRRRQIQARGGVLLRSIAINRAMNQDAEQGAPLH